MKTDFADKGWNIQGIVETALAEDIGSGDITTIATVERRLTGEAEIVAGEDMALAGVLIAEAVFKTVDAGMKFKSFVNDGDRIGKDGKIARVSGRLSSILTAERVALNFLQRLSGVATLTRSFVDEIKDCKAKILDTRKTTPGLRILEKYAVRMGGGLNHRFGLCDAVLIKDNHIAAVGGIEEAVFRARDVVQKGILPKDMLPKGMLPKDMLIEVEVKNLVEVKQAVLAGSDIIMLDNMTVSDMAEAVKMIGGAALVEASGGVNLKNVRQIAETGVDYISVGALTHSARAVDISLDILRVS